MYDFSLFVGESDDNRRHCKRREFSENITEKIAIERLSLLAPLRGRLGGERGNRNPPLFWVLLHQKYLLFLKRKTKNATKTVLSSSSQNVSEKYMAMFLERCKTTTVKICKLFS